MRWMAGVAAILTACAMTAAMAKDIPPGASTMARVNPGTTGSGSEFDYAGDQDAWRVRLDAGKNYIITGQTWCHNKQLQLLDRGFRPIVTSTPPRPDLDGSIEYTPRYTGLHFLAIKDGGVSLDDCHVTERAIYNVMAAPSCAPTRKTTCVLPPGRTVESAIWAYTDRDWWRLNITEPGLYYIVGDTDSNGNSWYWGGTISLRRGDTSVIAESGKGDRFACSEGEACVKAYLGKGLHYVALRMPLSEGATGYRLTATRR